MAKRIHDADVRMLAAFAATLEPDYIDLKEQEAWEGSPFAWIRSRPSRQKGKIGEQLVAGWCATKEFDVVKSPDAEADRIIQGRRVEIKFSTLWKSGVYKFQQLRDQNYEYAICLAVSPFDAHCWVISKELLRQHVIGHTPQHMGKRGTDTAWLSFPVIEPPRWLHRCGGRLAQAARIIASF
jgi:hypothetical protein